MTKQVGSPTSFFDVFDKIETILGYLGENELGETLKYTLELEEGLEKIVEMRAFDCLK